MADDIQQLKIDRSPRPRRNHGMGKRRWWLLAGALAAALAATALWQPALPVQTASVAQAYPVASDHRAERHRLRGGAAQGIHRLEGHRAGWNGWGCAKAASSSAANCWPRLENSDLQASVDQAGMPMLPLPRPA
jgi:hypothetical protein